MRSRSLVTAVVVVALAALGAGCATSRIVGQNVHRVVNGQPVDQSGLSQAVAADTKDLELNLQQLKSKFAEAVAQLRGNVQKRWGKSDDKVAGRTTYVKYTQGYKSRVVTDFDHGTLTVETLDDKDPQGSLKAAIVSALLTSNDPAAVDLFTDKDVAFDANRRPYLYGLVHDNLHKPIRTRQQAEKFAQFLVPGKMQTRPVAAEQGAKTARFVTLTMVRNFETKEADHFRAAVDKYSAQYHVSPSLVLAIIRTESNFNPFAVSGAPAYGLMQLVPTSGGRDALKRVQGVDQTPTPEYLLDPEHNIELGAAYLGELNDEEFRAVSRQDSRDYCVIAAYNTGARNVTRTFAAEKRQALDNINALEPPALFEQLRTKLPFEETRQYVMRVSVYRRQFEGPALTPAAAGMQ